MGWISNIFKKKKVVEPIKEPVKEPEIVVPPVIVQAKAKNYLALIIGHSKADKGAEGVAPLSKQEYDYNNEVAHLAKLEATKHNIMVEIFYRDIGGVRGAYNSACAWLDLNGSGAIMELHFNAANKKAIGTEVLYADTKDLKGFNEKMFAQSVLDSMYLVFGRDGKSKRGLKRETGAKGERGYSNLSQTVKYPSIIVEPFFGDVTSEAKMALEKQNEYAISLINGYSKYLEG